MPPPLPVPGSTPSAQGLQGVTERLRDTRVAEVERVTDGVVAGVEGLLGVGAHREASGELCRGGGVTERVGYRRGLVLEQRHACARVGLESVGARLIGLTVAAEAVITVVRVAIAEGIDVGCVGLDLAGDCSVEEWFDEHSSGSGSARSFGIFSPRPRVGWTSVGSLGPWLLAIRFLGTGLVG